MWQFAAPILFTEVGYDGFYGFCFGRGGFLLVVMVLLVLLVVMAVMVLLVMMVMVVMVVLVFHILKT